MTKLSSQIDVLKSSRAQRLHNYYGLRKSRVDSGTPKVVTAGWRRVSARSFLADFGCHFGPSWIPRGVQKSCFRVSCWKNDEQRGPKTRPEKTSNCDWTFVSKWEGLGGENERFAGDLLQNKGFRGIVKYRENLCQKGSKKRPKSEPKTLRDQIFEIFGRFGGIRNLDGFWERKKWTENLKKSEIWSPMVVRMLFWGWPGRVCGRGWGFGVCKFSIPIWHATSPERGRRIQSLRAFRRAISLAWLIDCVGVCSIE